MLSLTLILISDPHESDVDDVLKQCIIIISRMFFVLSIGILYIFGLSWTLISFKSLGTCLLLIKIVSFFFFGMCFILSRAPMVVMDLDLDQIFRNNYVVVDLF